MPSSRSSSSSPTSNCAPRPSNSASAWPRARPLDDLLVEAFATVREAAKRTLGQRHFDVQLKGGMVLHQGKIAEMKTGEGKTLVATLPVYLNALEGKGVHVVTVNDYLAKRDSEWMGQIYKFLGLSVGVIVHELDRRAAQGGLRLRRHLRHQQRAGLRLPARQHEVPAGRHGPAALQLRHRRRGQFDPDRRGAHAAHHLRPGRGFLGTLPPRRHRDPAPQGRPFREGREEPHGRPDRRRRRGGRGHPARRRPAARGHQPLRPDPGLGAPSRHAGAARPQAVRPRRRLHRQGRPGRHHRRVHRPHDGRPALLRGPAPGARGQGEGRDPAREPDAGLDHLPEPVPHVSQAGRHDRHGDDRGRRVRRDLQARGRRDPDQRGGRPARTPTTRSTARFPTRRAPSSS